MIQEIRERLGALGLLLDLKEDQVAEMFDSEQLRAYFRCKDAIRMLIPSLFDLERALYENKILV